MRLLETATGDGHGSTDGVGVGVSEHGGPGSRKGTWAQAARKVGNAEAACHRQKMTQRQKKLNGGWQSRTSSSM